MGDACLLVPSTYPSIPAMVLKKGASQKAHAAWATLAFSSVGEPMLFDLVEAAKNPTEDAPPPPPPVVRQKAAPVVAPKSRRRRAHRFAGIRSPAHWANHPRYASQSEASAHSDARKTRTHSPAAVEERDE